MPVCHMQATASWRLTFFDCVLQRQLGQLRQAKQLTDHAYTWSVSRQVEQNTGPRSCNIWV